MQEIFDWFYARVLEFLSTFFTTMNNMGAEIFNLAWIKAITDFFGLFAWALYAAGLVVAVFDCAIEAQSGRMTLRETALNIIKGFIACGAFTTVPAELYKFSVSLQGLLGHDLIGVFADSEVHLFDLGAIADNLIHGVVFRHNTIWALFLMIMVGYCVIKVFFANIKRGGILLTSIALGSLHMFSVTRGYSDGFTSWCKQIIGICFTSFMQTTLLIAGLATFNVNSLLGLGIMLASGEVPRIAGQFGMDTGTRGNVMSVVYAAQSAMSMTRTLVKAVPK
jgi:hypothetical protein